MEQRIVIKCPIAFTFSDCKYRETELLLDVHIAGANEL